MTEHFRMSGMYWGLTAMDILSQLDKMSRTEVVEFIRQCQDAESGGFSPSLGHDPHLLFTLSAVQVSKADSLLGLGLECFKGQVFRKYNLFTIIQNN